MHLPYTSHAYKGWHPLHPCAVATAVPCWKMTSQPLGYLLAIPELCFSSHWYLSLVPLSANLIELCKLWPINQLDSNHNVCMLCPHPAILIWVWPDPLNLHVGERIQSEAYCRLCRAGNPIWDCKLHPCKHPNVNQHPTDPPFSWAHICAVQGTIYTTSYISGANWCT